MILFLLSKGPRWAWWLAKKTLIGFRAVATPQVVTITPLLIGLLLLPWLLFPGVAPPSQPSPRSVPANPQVVAYPSAPLEASP